MKKIFSLILIVAFGLFGAILGLPSFDGANAEELPQVHEISTARQFVELLQQTSEDNADKNFSEKTKLNLKLVDNLDFSDQQIKDFTFYGVLDGNGYSISNLQMSSSGKNIGLFAEAREATIKNLKVTGNAIFNFGNERSINAGVLVGYGTKVKFDSCEIDVNLQTQTDQIDDGIITDANMNFGVFAGDLSENSFLTNCINYSSINLTNVGSGMLNIGGMVGSYKPDEMASTTSAQQMGRIEYAINYGSISAEGQTQNVGGLIGLIQAGKIDLQNCAVMSNEISCQTGNVGSIAGALSSLVNYNLNGSVIDYCYYLTTPSALGDNAGFAIGGHCAHEAEMPTSFFTNSRNWSPNKSKFNFDTVYMFLGQDSAIHLQVFQTFEFKVSDVFDEALEFIRIEGAAEQEPRTAMVKYGEPVKIYVKYKDDRKNFYDLPTVSIVEGGAIETSSYTIESVDGTQILLTILASSFKTQGTYNFVPVPRSFECRVESSQDQQGRVRWGASNVRSLNFGDPIPAITAEGIGSYAFEQWQLFKGVMVENEIEWATDPDASFAQSQYAGSASISNSSSQLIFGQAPFDTYFKLVAYFSQDSALRCQFNSDDHISNINFYDEDYSDQDILVSPMARSVELRFSVAKGYEFNEENFLKDIKVLYGESSINTVRANDPVVNEDGTTDYLYRLNMIIINQNLDGKQLTLSLSTSRVEGGNKNSLLWLWITLPVVAVLVIGGTVALVIIRRRMYSNFSRKTEKKTEQKSDNNDVDFYY